MVTLKAESDRVIGAAPSRVYAILADYRHSHPRILPKDFFKSVEVVEGGQGAGTILRVRGRLLGLTRELRMRVAEPEPGRVLTETDLKSGLVTIFTVESRGAAACKVSISSIWEARTGLLGFLERLLIPRVMRRVYQDELALLETIATAAA
jgi:hypothetical protein